jgi:NAD(P)-dependent dehydrogenase (short-subunit alcohol dehydrogenase family)
VRGVIAVVTGAGSGIGRAAARALRADGWELVLAGRREAPLRETLPDAKIVPTDITDPAQVHGLFEAAGPLDLLFNNAGIGASAPIEDLALEDWQRVVDTNLTGAFLCDQAAFRAMLGRGGRIINNGSLAAHVPRPNAVAYTATKHAITGLTKALSLEGRDHDIACGQIDIGNAATPMTEAATEPTIDVALVGRAVAQMAALPLDANVQFMTIMATKMPFIGRG